MQLQIPLSSILGNLVLKDYFKASVGLEHFEILAFN